MKGNCSFAVRENSWNIKNECEQNILTKPFSYWIIRKRIPENLKKIFESNNAFIFIFHFSAFAICLKNRLFISLQFTHITTETALIMMTGYQWWNRTVKFTYWICSATNMNENNRICNLLPYMRLVSVCVWVEKANGKRMTTRMMRRC